MIQVSSKNPSVLQVYFPWLGLQKIFKWANKIITFNQHVHGELRSPVNWYILDFYITYCSLGNQEIPGSLYQVLPPSILVWFHNNDTCK